MVKLVRKTYLHAVPESRNHGKPGKGGEQDDPNTHETASCIEDTVMSKVIASIFCAAALTVAPAAYAVDVENQDDTDHEITVSIGDAAPMTVLLKAGEMKADLCKGASCVLMLNEKAWEAEADDQFVVREGELISQTRG